MPPQKRIDKLFKWTVADPWTALKGIKGPDLHAKGMLNNWRAISHPTWGANAQMEQKNAPSVDNLRGEVHMQR